MRGRKHYHVYLSAWRDGKAPRALFDTESFYHRNQAYRHKDRVTADPRDKVVVLSCEHPECWITTKDGKVKVERVREPVVS